MFPKKIILAVMLLMLFGLVYAALAQINIGEEVGRQLGAAGASAGFGAPVEPAVGAVKIINYVLGLVSIVFVTIILYAGFTWLTAGGNTERVEKAKKLIFNSIIGLIIVVSAWAITLFAIELAWKSKAPRDLPAGIYMEPPAAGAPCPYGDAYCNRL